jgi:hypothetical protein
VENAARIGLMDGGVHELHSSSNGPKVVILKVVQMVPEDACKSKHRF